MLDNHYSFFKTALCFLVINFLLFPVMGFSGVVDEKLKGDDKLSENQIEEAEKHYAKALQMDPENWKIMRSLAEVRFQLKKYCSFVFLEREKGREVINLLFFEF